MYNELIPIKIYDKPILDGQISRTKRLIRSAVFSYQTESIKGEGWNTEFITW